MADVTQTTTWQFKVDFTDLNEFEKRLRVLTERQKELERGFGGNPREAINLAAQEARSVDSVTAAYDRQKRTVDALNAAKARMGRDTGLIHGPWPANGPAYGPRPGYPRDTGMQYGPMGRPITPRDTGTYYGPGGGPVNPSAQHAMWLAVNRSQVGLHGSTAPEFMMGDAGFPNSPHPMLQTRQQQIDAMRASILARHYQANERMTMDAAFFDDALGGRSFSRMSPLSGGRSAFNGMGTYGGMSAATIAIMNRRQAMGPGFRFNSGLGALSSFGQAAVGLNMAFDPDMDPMGRFGGALWGGMELGAGVQSAGRAIGGRGGIASAMSVFRSGGAAGSVARVAGPAAVAYAGLKAAEGFHGWQSYQSEQKGAGFDAHFEARNSWRTEMDTILDRQRANQARERSDFMRRWGNTQHDRFTGRLGERFGYEAATDQTFTDPVEYVNNARSRMGGIASSIQLTERNIASLRRQLEAERDPTKRRQLQNNLRVQNERMVAYRSRRMEIGGGIADRVLGVVGERDAFRGREADIRERYGDRPIPYEVTQDLGRLGKQASERERLIEQMGLSPDITADGLQRSVGRFQRSNLEAQRLAAGEANRMGDANEFSESLQQMLEEQARKLEANTAALDRNTQALMKTIDPKLFKPNMGAGIEPLRVLGPAITAIDFMTAWE